MSLSSMSSYLSLLNDPEPRLAEIGLKKVLEHVDTQWAQIADRLGEIEKMGESGSPLAPLAAFTASKVYYHLEEYSTALAFALQAPLHFDPFANDKYTQTLLNHCIQQFIASMQARYEEPRAEVDSRVVAMVEGMLKQSVQEGSFRLVVGIALESMRIDLLQMVIAGATQEGDKAMSDLLDYIVKMCNKFVSIQKFRVSCLELVVEALQGKSKEPWEYCSLAQCYFSLGKAKEVADLLVELLDQPQQLHEHSLLAFQIAQDISENEDQLFSKQLAAALPERELCEDMSKLKRILDGSFGEDLKIEFVKQRNQTDKEVILALKKSVESKNSVGHNGVIMANSIIQTGTTQDCFMREHFDWCSKATHWSKFQLVSSLGAIHKGNHLQSMDLLKPYFPGNTPTPNYYAHGGSLYALGLIHSNTKDPRVTAFVQEAIANANANEQILHGATLALGLIGIGSEDPQIQEQLNNILYSNNAITGESSALAIGLLMAGSGNQQVVEELLQYARETEHEKIIRSLVLAIAMVMFKKEEHADYVIKDMTADKDPIVRYGAMFATGMAYIGTSNQKSIRALLYQASSDHSDDVKRAAVINLGFVMLNNLDKLPKIISLLVGSYNPHVRFGAAMALGIASHGRPLPQVTAILEPMLKDSSDIVRQSAFVSLGMVLQQTHPASNEKRASLETAIGDFIKKPHGDNITRLGALFSQAILESGGRNQMIQLTSRNGEVKMRACLGMMAFLNQWYWFPFNQFFCLTLAPSAFMGVTHSFKVPAFPILSNAKPSQFGYVPMRVVQKKKGAQPLDLVKLSIADKAKARGLHKKKDNAMEVEEEKKEEKMEEKKEEKKEEEEPKTQLLTNPCRVLPKQEDFLQVQSDRYSSVIKVDSLSLSLEPQKGNRVHAGQQGGGGRQPILHCQLHQAQEGRDRTGGAQGRQALASPRLHFRRGEAGGVQEEPVTRYSVRLRSGERSELGDGGEHGLVELDEEELVVFLLDETASENGEFVVLGQVGHRGGDASREGSLREAGEGHGAQVQPIQTRQERSTVGPPVQVHHPSHLASAHGAQRVGQGAAGVCHRRKRHNQHRSRNARERTSSDDYEVFLLREVFFGLGLGWLLDLLLFFFFGEHLSLLLGLLVELDIHFGEALHLLSVFLGGLVHNVDVDDLGLVLGGVGVFDASQVALVVEEGVHFPALFLVPLGHLQLPVLPTLQAVAEQVVLHPFIVSPSVEESLLALGVEAEGSRVAGRRAVETREHLHLHLLIIQAHFQHLVVVSLLHEGLAPEQQGLLRRQARRGHGMSFADHLLAGGLPEDRHFAGGTCSFQPHQVDVLELLLPRCSPHQQQLPLHHTHAATSSSPDLLHLHYIFILFHLQFN